MDELSAVIDQPAAGANDRDGPPDRLQLSPSMHVEQSDATGVTVYLRATGTRLRIPQALYELLLQFEAPRSMVTVAGGDVRMASALKKLELKGFLIPEGDFERSAPPRLVTDPPVRLFNCPAHKLVPARSDVVVVGIPYDLSDPDAAGARHAPAALRETSLQMLYGLDRRSGRPVGWFDADLARPILRGITIADCGDARVVPGERQADLFARISEIVVTVTEHGSMPLLLGGDCAICFPAIAHLQRKDPLAVIRIGTATRNRGEIQPSFVSPSRLPERLLRLPGVEHYLHIGPSEPFEDTLADHSAITAPELRSRGAAALHSILATGQRVYVGLDMSALSTPGDPMADQPESAHFSYAELHSLLRVIGDRCVVAGFDLVGANPLKPAWGAAAMTAIHLLLTGLSAARDRAGGELRS